MRTKAIFIISTICALAVATVVPVAAVPFSTPITIEITPGTLSITAPTGPVDLGEWVNTVGGGTISEQLGQVQVLDARGAAAGSSWEASVIASALTPTTPPGGPAIAADNIGYSAGSIVKVGTATYTANNQTDLTAYVPTVTASGITGDNSATWNPTITVVVAGGLVAAVYSGTITHSLL